MDKMKVGILGSGDVGKALARGFLAHGHEVRIGSREPEKLRDFVESAGGNIASGTFAEAAQFGDLIVLALLGTATDAALRMAGPTSFAGKVVIDATNPLDYSGGMPPKLFVGTTDSLGERIQRWLPDAQVVKAFNTVGHALMVNPDLPGGPPDMFIAGNHDEGKKTVSEVCQRFGWGVIDLGGIDASRYLEPMCLTWVLHGVRSGSWTHAFKMLHQ